jgi:hypothetical protein
MLITIIVLSIPVPPCSSLDTYVACIYTCVWELGTNESFACSSLVLSVHSCTEYICIVFTLHSEQYTALCARFEVLGEPNVVHVPRGLY